MSLTVSRTTLVIGLMLLLRVASGVTANASYLFAAIYALVSRRHAIEALFLSFLFTNLNGDLIPAASLTNLARYFIVLAAFVSVFGRDILQGGIRMDRTSAVVLIFGMFTLAHSVLLSVVPMISFLKATIWLLAFLTLLRAWSSIDEHTRERVTQRIYVLLSTAVVLSVAVSFHPSAYLVDTQFLQGVFNHSQALGSIAVVVAVWSLIRALSHPRPPWIDLFVSAVATLAVVASGARTALLTLAITLVILAVLAFLRLGQLRGRNFVGAKSFRFAILGGCGILILFSQLGVILDVLIKGESLTRDAIDLTTLYVNSRGLVIGEMWANIGVDPLIGIGFGIASNPSEMVVTYVGGIPVGAVVEKGVTLLAVWEELGAIGLSLFIMLILVIFVRSIRSQPERVAVFIAILLINLGEASLMSAGGVGLLQIVLLGWIVSGEQKTSYPQQQGNGFLARPDR